MDTSAGDSPSNASDARTLYAFKSPNRSLADENLLVERVDTGIISAMSKAAIQPHTQAGREVRQRAWVYVLKHLDQYEPRLGALSTWAHVQTQAVITAWFKEMHRTPVSIEEYDKVYPKGQTGFFEFEMRDLLQVLPEADRNLIKKVVMEEVGVRRFALNAGVSHTYVYQRLRRAFDTLRFQMVG